MKICSKCNQNKEETEFPWVRKDKQLRNQCKECYSELGRKKYRLNEGKRTCKVCNETKDIEMFKLLNLNAYSYNTYSFSCASCYDDYLEIIRQKQIEYNRNYNKSHRRKYKYGLEHDDYLTMVEKQNGLCAICQEIPKRRGLMVDHNHNTGTIRGLLCDTCNRAIGLLKDNFLILARASEYLKIYL